MPRSDKPFLVTFEECGLSGGRFRDLVGFGQYPGTNKEHYGSKRTANKRGAQLSVP